MSNDELVVIENLGETNVLRLSHAEVLKISKRSESKFELYMCSPGSTILEFWKFSSKRGTDRSSTAGSSKREKKVTSKLKVFHCPFPIQDIAVKNNKAVIIGTHNYAIINADTEASDMDIRMDVDSDSEFQLSDFVTRVDPLNSRQHGIVCSDLFVNSTSTLISVCYADVKKNLWFIKLCSINNKLGFDEPPLLSFPIDSAESTNQLQPKVAYFQLNVSQQDPSASKNDVLLKLSSLDTTNASNHLCLIGQSNGEVLFSLIAVMNMKCRLKRNTQLLFDFKQHIIGINLLKDFLDHKGSSTILICGALGKLAFLSAKEIFTDSQALLVNGVIIFLTVLQLNSLVQSHVYMNSSVLFSTPKGDVWLAKFSTKKSAISRTKKNLVISLVPITMQGVLKFIPVDVNEGLIVVVTNSGNIYFSKLGNEDSGSSKNLPSLPLLMNDIICQSQILQDLQLVKVSQSLFFAALSTFASIKYKKSPKVNISCSVLEVNTICNKFIVDVDITEMEKLNLNPEFWFVTASIYSCFQRSIVASKTVPFTTGKNIQLEIPESTFSLPNLALFPMHLEIGLILHLPQKYKSMKCFKPISRKLPMHVSLLTLIVNELHLLKENSASTCDKITLNSYRNDSSSNIFQKIKKLSLEKPIARCFSFKEGEELTFPKKFVISVQQSSFQSLLEGSTDDTDRKDKILRFLIRKSNLQNVPPEGSFFCRNRPVTIAVTWTQPVKITVSSASFIILCGLRTAIEEAIFTIQTDAPSSSKGVCIPTEISRKCNVLSKSLQDMYGKDVDAPAFLSEVLELYCSLRDTTSRIPC